MARWFFLVEQAGTASVTAAVRAAVNPLPLEENANQNLNQQQSHELVGILEYSTVQDQRLLQENLPACTQVKSIIYNLLTNSIHYKRQHKHQISFIYTVRFSARVSCVFSTELALV